MLDIVSQLKYSYPILYLKSNCYQSFYIVASQDYWNVKKKKLTILAARDITQLY